MTLVDTSAWIEFFRDRGPLAARIDAALANADVAIAGPIITEIRRGIRAPERKRILPLLRGCALLSDPPNLWESAGDLGHAIARRGATVKTLDLLIATYAIAHRVPLLTSDRDFEVIAAHSALRLA